MVDRFCVEAMLTTASALDGLFHTLCCSAVHRVSLAKFISASGECYVVRQGRTIVGNDSRVTSQS